MHPIHIHRWLPALMLTLAACTTSSPEAPTPLPTSFFDPTPASSSPQPGTPLAPALTAAGTVAPAGPVFALAAIADTTTGQLTREQAQAYINEAATFLREFSPVQLVMMDFVEDGAGGSMADLANRYMSAHATSLPPGLVIFSAGDSGRARLEGGYGFAVSPPLGYQSHFPSPAVGDGAIYVAVVDAAYKYMACGYGGSSTPQSTSSLPGECNNKAGVSCVQHNGYSMCNTALGNLYTSTPTHAVSSMIVHGLLHNFGPNGDQDHYATPQCNERMGYPAAFYDLQQGEYYNGICPFVYDLFTKSYRP